MLSEADFDDLISLDRKDMRRHMILAASTALLGALVIVLGSVAGLSSAASGGLSFIGQFFGQKGLLGQLAGSAIAMLSGPSITKYLKVRRNIDRLEMLRRRWRRLIDDKANKSGVSEIKALLMEAMK